MCSRESSASRRRGREEGWRGTNHDGPTERSHGTERHGKTIRRALPWSSMIRLSRGVFRPTGSQPGNVARSVRGP